MSSTRWDRIVRFVSEDAIDQFQYGEPILQNPGVDDIAELAALGKLRVRVFDGSDPFNAKPSNRTETVRTLLGPLASQDVPIIRCIGLNYKTHSKIDPTLL